MAGPYAHANVRCTIAGLAFGGLEEWATGFWLGHENADAEDPTVAAADAIRALWDTFYAGNPGTFSNTHSTTIVKLSKHFASDGKTDPSKTVFANIQTPVTGINATTKHPPQTALVVTLLSARLRGPASHGRMYLPGPGTNLDSTAHISTSDRDAIADRMKTFFDGVKASASIPWDPILQTPEKLLPPPAHDKANVLITGLKVGNVLDTQRRRRNQLVEVYASRTLA